MERMTGGGWEMGQLAVAVLLWLWNAVWKEWVGIGSTFSTVMPIEMCTFVLATSSVRTCRGDGWVCMEVVRTVQGR